MQDLDEIRDRAARGMRGYMTSEGAERTLAVKALAQALVDARAFFFTRDGDPDLLGTTNDYRSWVAETIDSAGVPKGLRSGMQSTARYHVSSILRDRYGEEVAALGLKPDSTKERGRRRRARDNHIVSLFSGGGEVNELDDALLIANLARLAVNRVSGVGDADARNHALAVDAYRNLEEAVSKARERVESSRS